MRLLALWPGQTECNSYVVEFVYIKQMFIFIQETLVSPSVLDWDILTKPT